MHLVRRLLLVAMLGIAFGIVAGFAGRIHPVFDTLSNFRLHLSVGLLVLAAAWSFRCSKAPSIVFALIGFGGLFACAPGLPMTSYSVTPAGGEKIYRLFAMNLFWGNPTPERVTALIEDTDPDLLYLTEVSRNWQAVVDKLRARYRYIYHCAEWRTVGGSVILSRLPIVGDKDFCGQYATLGLTQIQIGDKTIAAGVVHLRWPWPASGPRQIEALKPVLGKVGKDALIAGDFNTTTWSLSIKRFAEAGGLEIVTGIGPSWGPAFGPGKQVVVWPPKLGLPIDNAMVKGAVKVVNARTLSRVGSDHLPVLLEFVVRD